jgi:hypothetical protein
VSEHDPSSTEDVPATLKNLTDRVRTLELESLQLRKENLFVQLRLLALERGHELADDDPDAAALLDQVTALRARIDGTS